jgi:hypothetical protein
MVPLLCKKVTQKWYLDFVTLYLVSYVNQVWTLDNKGFLYLDEYVRSMWAECSIWERMAFLYVARIWRKYRPRKEMIFCMWRECGPRKDTLFPYVEGMWTECGICGANICSRLNTGIVGTVFTLWRRLALTPTQNLGTYYTPLDIFTRQLYISNAAHYSLRINKPLFILNKTTKCPIKLLKSDI